MPGAEAGSRLELDRPGGAFRSIEDFLRGHGFFEPGGERLEADLFLGYGLSGTIRRGDSSSTARRISFAATTV